jgi:hypothetical protein
MPPCKGDTRLHSTCRVVSRSLPTEFAAVVRRICLDSSCGRDGSSRSRPDRGGPVATNRRRRQRPTRVGEGVPSLGHRHPEGFRACFRFPWGSRRIRCHSLGSPSRQVLGDSSRVSDLARRLPGSSGAAVPSLDRSGTTQGSRNRRRGRCWRVLAHWPGFGLGPPTLDPGWPPGSC